MTPPEIRAWNSAILCITDIARRSADALKSDPRHIPIAFAIAALDQLAIDAKVLLIRPAGDADADVAPNTNPIRQTVRLPSSRRSKGA